MGYAPGVFWGSLRILDESTKNSWGAHTVVPGTLKHPYFNNFWFELDYSRNHYMEKCCFTISIHKKFVLWGLPQKTPLCPVLHLGKNTPPTTSPRKTERLSQVLVPLLLGNPNGSCDKKGIALRLPLWKTKILNPKWRWMEDDVPFQKGRFSGSSH